MGWILTGVGLGLIFAKIQRQIDPCVNIEAELDKNIEFKFLTQLNSFTRFVVVVVRINIFQASK